VKHGATGRVFVTVNGGMSDNPRPALYGADYSVRLIGRRATAANRTMTVVGRHCDAGDVLVRDAELPKHRLGPVSTSTSVASGVQVVPGKADEGVSPGSAVD
jgi:diaminopimelate decarboxylase